MREVIWAAEDKETFQVFTRSTRSCRQRYVSQQEIDEFNFVLMKSKIRSYVIHAPYTMNPASPDKDYRDKATRIIQEDMDFLSKLAGVKYYVIHPGSHKGIGVVEGMINLTAVLNSIDTHGVIICIENMAGGGTQIFSSPDEMDFLRVTTKYKFAFDTAHAYQAGYDPLQWYERNKDRIAVVHLNNSATVKASHNDIHASIDAGHMTPVYLHAIFESIPNHVPVILETPVATMEEDYAYLKI